MNKNLLVLILLFTILLNGFGVDIYVPSLPMVKEFLHTSTSLVQLTIGAYLLGFALIQLVIGTVCDSIGRKKPYLYSLILYTIFALMITQIHDIYSLLILRFMQGLTVGCFVVACRAMIVDLFQGKKLQDVSNYTSIAFAIGPIIAPMIGGYLQHYFRWQTNFYFLCVYAILCITLGCFYLPETLQVRKKWSIHHWATSSKIVLKHTEFWIGTVIIGGAYSLLILFNVVAPFLLEVVMHYSVVTYGYIALIMGSMWFLGTISNKLLHNVKKLTKTKYCLTAMLLSVLIMFLLSIKLTNLYVFTIPTGIIFYFGGMLFSVYYAHNMAILPNTIAATAGAFMGATVVTIGAPSS